MVHARQTKGSPPPAPVPAQILTAKRVFVSNAGGDADTNFGDSGIYGAEPADPYNRLYDAMKDWAGIGSSMLLRTRTWYSRYV
jgi:hypothetical protein